MALGASCNGVFRAYRWREQLGYSCDMATRNGGVNREGSVLVENGAFRDKKFKKKESAANNLESWAGK